MLLHTSEQSETRTLTVIGAVLATVCVAVAAVVMFVPVSSRPKGAISIAIDTPYIGQGVATGTALVMHGVTVGQVTDVSRFAGGAVRLKADLQTRPTAGLTDSMKIDFRPVNYFGVTGINLSPGTTVGQPLRDGITINTVPEGNFALQALLTRLGEITTGVVTPQLTHVIDWSTRYIDSLTPLIETMLVATDALARVQTVSTKQLLTNATGLSVVFPGFFTSLADSGDNFIHVNVYTHIGTEEVSEDFFNNRAQPAAEKTEHSLFGAAGRLLVSHPDDLHDVVGIAKTLFDVVTPLIRPQEVGQMLVEMRTRFEKMYGGTPERRALQVHLVLDSLPGVAAPIAAIGGRW